MLTFSIIFCLFLELVQLTFVARFTKFSHKMHQIKKYAETKEEYKKLSQIYMLENLGVSISYIILGLTYTAFLSLAFIIALVKGLWIIAGIALLIYMLSFIKLLISRNVSLRFLKLYWVFDAAVGISLLGLARILLN